VNNLTHIVHFKVESRSAGKPVMKKTASGFFRVLFICVLLTAVFSGIKLYAQDEIEVGGTLTENEVWTKEHIYIVNKDLRIPDTVTLVIQEGVTVKIDQGRGIFVLGGNLFVQGLENDSVIFKANYARGEKDWYWKGISYTGVSGIGENSMAYAKLFNAEIAIDSYNSEDITINNSSFFSSQNIGVRLFNSRNCQIVDCRFVDNYDGIEMVATDGEEASGNSIVHCLLNNENHNIYLLKAYGGILVNNLVENNLIENGNNGIWLDNGGGEAFGRNMIRKNIIINNGANTGYGLLIGQDSIDVQYNIFWKNHIALFFDQATAGSVVANNSFYRNMVGMTLSAASVENEIYHNTFSMNSAGILNISETQGTAFRYNNLFTLPEQENVVTNNTPDDILLTENYWHDTIEENIQRLILDQEDNPALGKVIFIPFLPGADTVNPVVPPVNPIKQLVGNEVKVSWMTNPEEDLRSYKVYYGEFKNYTFPNGEEVGIDTAYFLSDFDITDTIAVTALDSMLMNEDAQVLGHESPFAFTEIYPYAGADNKICKMHHQFLLDEATIPYAYDEVLWTTDGDGIFDNDHIIHPKYYPGQQDRENGKVILTLAVTLAGRVKKDNLTLYIFDDPEVFAGNDTTLLADEQLALSASEALFYETLAWTTGGDGVFDNDTVMHPVYTPGQDDLNTGEVRLILTAISECGSSADTLILYLEPIYIIEGNVWQNNAPVNKGVVLAVKDSPEGARAIDLAQTDLNGFFRLNRVMEGDYVLYAVPDTLRGGEAVPGYYANKLRWQDAWNFHLDANTYDVDIMLPSVDYVLPEGAGSVSGYFVLPDARLFAKDIYCNSWFGETGTLTFCDGGLSNITVLLYNSTGDKLLDYTLTDENGNFYFSHLPYGNYLIDAEKAGCETTISPLITLSPDHPDETGVVIELDGNKKIGIRRTETQLPGNESTVWPNPAGSYIFIPVSEQVNGMVTVEIYNLMGRLIQKQVITKEQNGQPYIKLNTAKLNPGLCFVRITGKGTASSYTFIKK